MNPLVTALLSIALRYAPPLLGMAGVATSDPVAVNGVKAITDATSYTDDLQFIGSAVFTVITLAIQFYQKLKAERTKADVEERTIK